MSFEIERKFLVSGDGWKQLTTKQIAIRQAYLASTDKSSIRVRIKDDKAAMLTIKGKSNAMRRLECEYSIPLPDAEAMMGLRLGVMLVKTRHLVPWNDLYWEIDVFSGENAGLVLAEIELPTESRSFALPDWIGAEVTGEEKYYNSALAERPYCEWEQPASA